MSPVRSQKEALSQLSQKLKDLETRFPQLEGMTKLSIVTTSASVEPAYDPSCEERAKYGSPGSCPTIGNVGAATFQIITAPPEAAGPAIALLAELAATEVSFQGFSLSDESKLEAAADAAAMDDARARAQRLATSAGAELGSLVRVQFGDGLKDHSGYDPYRPPVLARPFALKQDVLSPKISPEIELSLAPRPIERTSKVTVGYSLKARSEQ